MICKDLATKTGINQPQSPHDSIDLICVAIVSPWRKKVKNSMTNHVQIQKGSMFGISGRFPPLYAGAVMMGQALGGVVPAVAAILMILFDVEAKILGPACFGAILILLCSGLLRWSPIS